MDEPLCVHCVQVAQLRMGLQQQGTLQHFNGFVGFPSFVCYRVAFLFMLRVAALAQATAMLLCVASLSCCQACIHTIQPAARQAVPAAL